MVYYQKYKSAHEHRYFIDANTGNKICLCGVEKDSVTKKPNKYHNKTQTYNGHNYDSTFEEEYAQALDYSLKSRDIKKWERQVKLDLKVNGVHITNYYIDFVVYHNDGTKEFIEVKGYENEVWKMKWKIFEAVFEDFKEGPDDFMTVVKQISWGPPKKRFNKK
jgi:hypothetical protein